MENSRINLDKIALILLTVAVILFNMGVIKELIDVNERLDQTQQQEQVEEGTITCPRCLKQFDVENQAPDYKKPQRRPAPCGTIK